MPFSPTSTQYLVGTPNRILDGFVRRGENFIIKYKS